MDDGTVTTLVQKTEISKANECYDQRCGKDAMDELP